MLQVLSYARDMASRHAAEASLAYQKHLIETLAHSKKEVKLKYNNLQHAIEFQSSPYMFSTTINTPVDVSAERSVEDALPQLPAFVALNSPAHEIFPNVKPRILVAELLLCFHLLDDLLGYHMTECQNHEAQMSTSATTYEELGALLSSILAEKNYHDVPLYQKSEAARNVQLRIKEILTSRYLKPRQVLLPTGAIWQAPGLQISTSLSSIPRDQIAGQSAQSPPTTFESLEDLPTPIIRASGAYTPGIEMQGHKIKKKDNDEGRDKITDPERAADLVRFHEDPRIRNDSQAEAELEVRKMLEEEYSKAQAIQLIIANPIAGYGEINRFSASGGFGNTKPATPWSWVMEALSATGNEGYKAIEGVKKVMYETRSKWFARDQENDEDYVVDEVDEMERHSGDVVADLLAQWTNLAPHLGV